MSDNATRQRSASWSILGSELRRRSFEPLFHASFVMYFVGAVVVVGGAGFWLELHTYLSNVSTAQSPQASAAALRVALITFFPALAGSSCMQLILAENEHKSLRAFAICILLALGLLALLIAPSTVSHLTALSVGGIASFLALWSWWLANAKQSDLLDPDAPVGGDPRADLAGDLGDYTV